MKKILHLGLILCLACLALPGKAQIVIHTPFTILHTDRTLPEFNYRENYLSFYGYISQPPYGVMLSDVIRINIDGVELETKKMIMDSPLTSGYNMVSFSVPLNPYSEPREIRILGQNDILLGQTVQRGNPEAYFINEKIQIIDNDIWIWNVKPQELYTVKYGVDNIPISRLFSTGRTLVQKFMLNGLFTVYRTEGNSEIQIGNPVNLNSPELFEVIPHMVHDGHEIRNALNHSGTSLFVITACEFTNDVFLGYCQSLNNREPAHWYEKLTLSGTLSDYWNYEFGGYSAFLEIRYPKNYSSSEIEVELPFLFQKGTRETVKLIIPNIDPNEVLRVESIPAQDGLSMKIKISGQHFNRLELRKKNSPYDPVESARVVNAYDFGDNMQQVFTTEDIFEEGCYCIAINYGHEVVQVGENILLLWEEDIVVEPEYTPAYNYIAERIYLSPSPNGSGVGFVDNVSYLDGFGGVSQQIAVNASSTGYYDLVTPYAHGTWGREEQSFLPYVRSQNKGAYVPDSFSASNWSVYGSSDADYAYTLTGYDDSPLDRVVKQTGPGAAWHSQDKSVITEYSLNGAGEVKSYRVGTDGSLIDAGYYGSGRLSKVSTTDEDGNCVHTFTDNQDRVLLTAIENGTDRHETYSIYDDRGQLRYVLSPEASSRLSGSITQSILDEYAYYYDYDPRGRMTSKKLPGCEPVYMVYDGKDRLVLSQDGNQRAESSGKWSYIIYDNKNRPSESGEVILNGNPAHAALQAQASATQEYTPAGVLTPFQYTLYDTYTDTAQVPVIPFQGVPGYATAYTTLTTGLVTGVRTRVLGEDTDLWVTTTNYYDDKCRLIQGVTLNIHGSRSQVDMRYDFVDNVLACRESHTIGANTDVLETVYTYDDRSRMLTSTATLNGGQPAVVTYNYDPLGRLESKSLGSTVERYDYNIRGWLTAKETPFFTMKLRYHNPKADNPARWNGNISEWEWGQGPNEEYMYGFTYDQLNRLTGSTGWQKSGTSWTVQTNSYLEKGITYDLNGNIRTLQRTASGTLVDDLSYRYTGNRLTGLTESVRTTPAGDVYPAGGSPDGTYGYDGNGNMVSDSREGLAFRYNSLDLLSEVSSGGNVKARYHWLADGTKLRVRDNAGHGYDYLGSLIYSASAAGIQLESAQFNGGVIRPGGTADKVNYFLSDHLGSVRTIVDGTGEVLERNDYYPFGARHIRADYQLSDNRFKYNGKEEQTTGSLNFLDYGARMYDARLNRWFTKDPLAEEFHNWSPYVYVNANPIIFIDPDGKKGILVIMGEARANVPISKAGIGFGLSKGAGIYIDWEKGEIAGFSSNTLGLSAGVFVGASGVLGIYPTAEIEDLGGFGFNLGFASEIAGFEFNFTTDLSAEGINEFIENMKFGLNLSGGKGQGHSIYFELGRTRLSEIYNFNKSIEELTMFLNWNLGTNMTVREGLQFLEFYRNIWNLIYGN